MPASKTTKRANTPAAKNSPVKTKAAANVNTVRSQAARDTTGEPRSNTRVMLQDIHVRGGELTAKISDLLRRLS